MMEDPSRRSKRAKTGSRLEEENAALRAALQASREETKAARDGERTALEEVAALKAELFARRRADERQSWLKKHGFDPDDVRKTKKHAFFYIDHNVVRFTPMMWACKLGDIEMCRNLFGSEAAADISTMASNGSSPMCISSQEGHLSVCKWLFEVGAAKDITIIVQGWTPMRDACNEGHLVVCQWLVRVGALNQINDDDEVHEDYFGDGHVDQAIVARDVVTKHRAALLEWALDTIALHSQYRDTVLRGSTIHVDTHEQVSPANRCRLPMLPSGVLERVGEFVGVVMGRQLRNVREFGETLETLLEEDSDDEEYEDDGEEDDEAEDEDGDDEDEEDDDGDYEEDEYDLDDSDEDEDQVE